MPSVSRWGAGDPRCRRKRFYRYVSHCIASLWYKKRQAAADTAPAAHARQAGSAEKQSGGSGVIFVRLFLETINENGGWHEWHFPKL
jgi:hypothetical protein